MIADKLIKFANTAPSILILFSAILTNDYITEGDIDKTDNKEVAAAGIEPATRGL